MGPGPQASHQKGPPTKPLNHVINYFFTKLIFSYFTQLLNDHIKTRDFKIKDI